MHFKDGELGTYMRPLSVYPPHEVVATAYACDEALFLKTFVGKDTEALHEYWRRASHKDFFKTHPYRPEMAISLAPVVVTGDSNANTFLERFTAGDSCIYMYLYIVTSS